MSLKQKKIKFKPRIIIKLNRNSCNEEISVLGQLGGRVISWCLYTRKQNAPLERRTDYDNQGALTITISLVIFAGITLKLEKVSPTHVHPYHDRTKIASMNKYSL